MMRSGSPVNSPDISAMPWALSETGVTGYAPSAWTCVGGSQDGSSITIGIGGEATCTITNDDIAPVLHLRKLVTNDNGGTAKATDWTLTATGTDGNDLSGATPVDSGAKLQADTWDLSESGPAGYAASEWDCTGGTQDGASITRTRRSVSSPRAGISTCSGASPGGTGGMSCT